MRQKIALFIAALLALATIAPVLAQDVPQELLPNTRRLQGDSINVCIDDLSIGAPLDHAIAQALADALFLTPSFQRGPGGFGLDAQGYMEEMQIAMNNTCDLFMGVVLQPDSTFPDWATVTRSYAQIPFVFVVADPAYTTLADIPRDKFLGTALGSLGELRLITYISQLPEAEQWRRLPYADPKLMLQRLKDGKLAGMYIWQPALLKVAPDLAAAGLKIIPTDPLPQVSVDIGALVSSRDSFLRSQIDDAIGALVADGTIAGLMTQQGIAGNAGP
jgi:polar amino acid transport system substrate-binding protein